MADSSGGGPYDDILCPRHRDDWLGAVSCPDCQALARGYSKRMGRPDLDPTVLRPSVRAALQRFADRSASAPQSGSIRDYRDPRVVADMKAQGFTDEMVRAMQTEQDRLRGSDGRVSRDRVLEQIAPNLVVAARATATQLWVRVNGVAAVILIIVAMAAGSGWWLLGVPAFALLSGCYVSYRVSSMLEQIGFDTDRMERASRQVDGRQ